VSSLKKQNGYALIELLAVISIVGITAAMYLPIAKKYGAVAGIGSGFITIVICVFIVIEFYRRSWRSDKKRLLELREKYQNDIASTHFLPIKKSPNGHRCRNQNWRFWLGSRTASQRWFDLSSRANAGVACCLACRFFCRNRLIRLL
jgi:prepilin-type N-terminal cleavage/methylation domain-containing protein